MAEKGPVGIEGVEEMRMGLGRLEAFGFGPLVLGFIQGNGFWEAQRRACSAESRGDTLGDGHAGEGGPGDTLYLDAFSELFQVFPFEGGGEGVVVEDGVQVFLSVAAGQDFQANDRFVESEREQYVGGSGEPDG